MGSTGSQTGSDFRLTTLPEPSLTVTKPNHEVQKVRITLSQDLVYHYLLDQKYFMVPQKNFQIFQNFRLGLISLLNILPF